MGATLAPRLEYYLHEATQSLPSMIQVYMYASENECIAGNSMLVVDRFLNFTEFHSLHVVIIVKTND